MKPGALLFTNTSAIDIDEIAGTTRRPEAVAGTHFFVPANVMKTVRGGGRGQDGAGNAGRSHETRPPHRQDQRLRRQLRRLRRQPQPHPLHLEQGLMIEEGALPEQVDKVMVDFGYPVGPFAVNDMSGLDISYDTRKRRAAADPELPQACRSPTGSWRWAAWGRRPAPAGIATRRAIARRIVDPEVHRIIREVAAEKGIEQRTFTDEEVLRRLLFSSLNEACKILEEGKALRASDIDVMWLQRLRLPALPRRADVLGRPDRRARGLQSDRRLAPALRRSLAALASAPGGRRKRREIPGAERPDAELSTTTQAVLGR